MSKALKDLADKLVNTSDDDVEEMFVFVCGGEHALKLIQKEMNNLYKFCKKKGCGEEGLRALKVVQTICKKAHKVLDDQCKVLCTESEKRSAAKKV